MAKSLASGARVLRVRVPPGTLESKSCPLRYGETHYMEALGKFRSCLCVGGWLRSSHPLKSDEHMAANNLGKALVNCVRGPGRESEHQGEVRKSNRSLFPRVRLVGCNTAHLECQPRRSLWRNSTPHIFYCKCSVMNEPETYGTRSARESWLPKPR
jgi:hypothetical protein